MKTKLSFLSLCLMLIAFGASSQTTITGDKKVIKREISIAEYDKLSLVGMIRFEYQQSNTKPYLEIEVDENILPYLNIEIKAGELCIEPKRTTFRNLQLRPSVCVVRSNSRDLKSAELVGGSSLLVNDQLINNEMKIETAGGATVILANLKTKKMKAEISGGGRVEVMLNQVEELDCDVAGGGRALFTGEVEKANMDVAGGGRIEALDCTISDAKCDVAGGGRIEINVDNKLEANVAGGGSVRYKGNPEVKKSTFGGGSVKPLN